MSVSDGLGRGLRTARFDTQFKGYRHSTELVRVGFRRCLEYAKMGGGRWQHACLVLCASPWRGLHSLPYGNQM